jgi:hypothetical protein
MGFSLDLMAEQQDRVNCTLMIPTNSVSAVHKWPPGEMLLA